MKKIMLLAAVSAIGIAASGECHSSFSDGGEFSVGCNYWASHAGMYMWRNWDAKQVEKDLDKLAERNEGQALTIQSSAIQI